MNKKKEVANVVVEKQISALNGSIINVFKQGITSGHGA
jgi:hypothetical protein